MNQIYLMEDLKSMIKEHGLAVVLRAAADICWDEAEQEIKHHNEPLAAVWQCRGRECEQVANRV